MTTEDTPRARVLEAIEAELPVWARQQAKRLANEARRVIRNNARHVNRHLYELGRTYHASVPLDTVSTLLETYGFNPLEAMLLCGREGHLHEPVGHDKWVSMTWYKMESGRYEIVAYLS
jgi:hypothetical protein